MTIKEVVIIKKGSNTSSTENDIPPFEGSIVLEEVIIRNLNNLPFGEFDKRFDQAQQIWANWGKGSFIEVNFNFAFIGGYGLTLGRLTDTFNKSAFYFSFNANIGWGGGFGFDAGTIETTAGNSFKVGDFEGQGATYNLGLTSPFGGIGGSKGGSVPNNMSATDKVFSPTKWGNHNRGYKQSSVSVGPKGNFQAGGWYQYSHTYLLK